MTLDAALVGNTITGILALLAQGISKCKFYVACRRDEEDCEPACACGFLDTTLGEIITPQRKDDETPCD